MKQYPELPDVADAPEVLDGGHLWIQERVDGGPLRFRMDASGLLAFGDGTRTFDAADPPLPYRRAVRRVRESFDRDALRAAVDDPAGVVFFGVATFHRGLAYDWERTPAFVGVDAWDGDAFLPPDRAEAAFDRLGLQPTAAVEKEVRAADFRPDSYEFPASAYRDGPAAGVVVRNKRGGRATLDNPRVERENPERVDADALAEEAVTEARVEREADEDSDAVTDRVLEAVAREHAHRLRDGRVDASALRDAVRERVRVLLDDAV